MQLAHLGHYLLVAAMIAFGFGAGTAFAAAVHADDRSRNIARRAGASLLVGTLFTVLATILLVVLLVQRDFSIRYVAAHVDSTISWYYALSALWAGEAGSLLTWLVCAAVPCALWAVISGRNKPADEFAGVLAWQHLILGFLLALVLLAGSPFAPKLVEVVEGQGLNPLLQDWAMVVHPPTLFAGYGLLTVPFALVGSALLTGRFNSCDWAAVRRWSLLAWAMLTVGIVLGMRWAYVELGWGGYWGWDPVENASLFPWLTTTVLLHTLLAQRYRGTMQKWNIILPALSLWLCFFGTFLTRSGILQSVHAFAASAVSDVLLALLAVILLAWVVLLVIRRSTLSGSPREPAATLSRDVMFVLNALVLMGLLVVVFIATMWPVITHWASMLPGLGSVFDRNRMLDAAFYNQVAGPLGIVYLAVLAMSLLCDWGQTARADLIRRIVPAIVSAVVAVIICLALGANHLSFIILAAVVGATAIIIIHQELRLSVETAGRMGVSPMAGLARLYAAAPARLGAIVVHVGMLLLALGIGASQTFHSEQDITLATGQRTDVGPYTISMYRTIGMKAPDDQQAEPESFLGAEFVASRGRDNRHELIAGQQIFPSGQRTNEVAIWPQMFEDLYVILNSGSAQQVTATVRRMPMVNWIWLGSTIMVLGSLISLAPRRMHKNPTDHVAAREVTT